MPVNSDSYAIEKARIAREKSSVTEQVMWKLLRNSRLGFKFRREHPIGEFRLDFYCAEAHIPVEMDGEQHDPIYDAWRDQDLAKHAILVYRIPNREFFGIDESGYREYLDEIVNLCQSKTSRKAFPD